MRQQKSPTARLQEQGSQGSAPPWHPDPGCILYAKHRVCSVLARLTVTNSFACGRQSNLTTWGRGTVCLARSNGSVINRDRCPVHLSAPSRPGPVCLPRPALLSAAPQCLLAALLPSATPTKNHGPTPQARRHPTTLPRLHRASSLCLLSFCISRAELS